MEHAIPTATTTSALTRVGLYGGSFDPVHLGHLKTAVYVLEYLNLERMYLMPNATPPHKASLKLPYEQRVHMIEAALQDFSDPRLQISFLEQDHSQKHYTYDTLQRFKQDHPQAEVFFIMGMDSFLTLNTWKNHEQLIALSNIVVLPRPHYELKDLPSPIRELSLPYLIDLRANASSQASTSSQTSISSQTSTPNSASAPSSTGVPYSRTATPVDTIPPSAHNHYYLLSAPEVDISSTQLRSLLKADCHSLTPEQTQLLNSTLSPSTLRYIKEHQLYH